MPIEESLDSALSYVVPIVEVCGALVIVIEVARTIFVYMIRYLRRTQRQTEALRLRLGRSMVMGLEFQVAADILKTALAPTWDDILRLGALIALRTVLNYLLEAELEKLDAGRGLATGYRDQPVSEAALSRPLPQAAIGAAAVPPEHAADRGQRESGDPPP
jgi:uncharacterized membrane protein